MPPVNGQSMTSWASCTPPTEDNYTRDNCLVDSPTLVRAASVSEYLTSVALCVKQSAFWAVAAQGACGPVSVRFRPPCLETWRPIYSKYPLIFTVGCLEYCWTPAWPASTTWDCRHIVIFLFFYFKGVNLFTGEPNVLFFSLAPTSFWLWSPNYTNVS